MEETCFFTNTFASHRSSRPQIQNSGKVEHSHTPKKMPKPPGLSIFLTLITQHSQKTSTLCKPPTIGRSINSLLNSGQACSGAGL
jgi:hypothetical protein